jgi:hypothetical protein
VEQADEEHFLTIAEKLGRGRMIPFLGAGANLCDRGNEEWEPGRPFLPSGGELARHLAARGRYPLSTGRDLSRVSQYVDAARGEDELYLYLHEVFESPTSALTSRGREEGRGVGEVASVPEYPLTSLHRMLARVAKSLYEAGLAQLLVVTTNYDDLVERALTEEGLEFDVVWYEAKKKREEARGHFVHRAPGKTPAPILKANSYRDLPIELERPAVLKLHGCLVRESATDDSYVITEDSYINYLSCGDVGRLLPIALSQRLATNSLLFLGYSLGDWNLRVVLNGIWGASKLQCKSWAVQREPADPNRSKIEQAMWETPERANIELVYCELSEYVKGLGARLPRYAPAASGR